MTISPIIPHAYPPAPPQSKPPYNQKESPSFCEQKEAKKLYPEGAGTA
jgi:hypothetical protein